VCPTDRTGQERCRPDEALPCSSPRSGAERTDLGAVDGHQPGHLGVEAATAQTELDERYQREQAIGPYVAYRLRSQVADRSGP
jgi:hypothetical protein